MSRRDMRTEREEYPPLPPSKCAKFLYYTWKLCSVVFSHFVMISLVVAYCILGAVTFEKLEAQYEREVKQNISVIRSNTTHSIWRMTQQAPFLQQDNWTSDVVDMLKDFENSILLEMKVRGWDGNESTDHIQWTFTGSLFYSIVVITTIGYGHLTPKTQTGKVVTIFYAILGIPLMLLCLSNIGDVMASSFRFLYWRVCCYVCTRPPKRRHHYHSRHTSIRRSVRGGYTRTSSRRRQLERAHSDTDCGRAYRDLEQFDRYVRDSGYGSARPVRARDPQHSATVPRTRSQPPPPRFDTMKNDTGVKRRSPRRLNKQLPRDLQDSDYDDFPKISLPLNDLEAAIKDLDEHQRRYSKEFRSKSLPRPSKLKDGKYYSDDFDCELDQENIRNRNILSKDLRKYDIEEGFDDTELYEMHDLKDVDLENYKERKALEERRSKRREYDDSVYRNDRKEERRNKGGKGYGSFRDKGYDLEDDDYDFDYYHRRRAQPDRRFNRGRSEYCERERAFPEKRRERDKRARSAVYNYERRYRDEYVRDLEANRDPGRGRRRLRRLQTFDDSRYTPPYNRYSPSSDREHWSDDAFPRRIRSDPRYPEIYPTLQDVNVVKEEIKPVPIWLCVFLVASYIVAGTFLFKRWEGWAYLDAAYFCFITLTTIGFGDFVPAQGQSGDPAAAVHSIALCSLYLLFGIALLAMSFNLVQEEVRANVAAVATKLGIIKAKDGDFDDDDY